MNQVNHTNHEMNHGPASFGAALRDAADSFTVPPTEDIHDRALRRGRQIKRRRALGVSMSAAVVVAAVGALAASVLSPGAPSQPSADALTATVANATAHMTRAQLGQYMSDHLRALLPPGARLAGPSLPAQLNGDGYSVETPRGDWTASAYVVVADGSARYTVSLLVTRGPVKQTCALHPPTQGVCTSKPLGTGTLVSFVSMTTPAKLATDWYYYWTLPDGTSVQLQVGPYYSPNPPALFTQQQAEALVTNPAWTSVLNGLPQIVHCDNLKMSEHGLASEWTCPSTGKTYPGPWMMAIAD